RLRHHPRSGRRRPRRAGLHRSAPARRIVRTVRRRADHHRVDAGTHQPGVLRRLLRAVRALRSGTDDHRHPHGRTSGVSHMGHHRSRSLQPYLLSTPALLVIALLFLVPSIYNVVLAFQELSPYQPAGDGEWIGLENFTGLLTSGDLGNAVFNTVFWLTLMTVVLRILAGLALALALQSPILRRWKLRGFSRTVILIPWMVPQVVAIAAWRWILDGNSGVLNQVLSGLGLVDGGI